MSGSLNKVTLIGHLGADPDVRSTQDGRQIVNIKIATTESWKDRNTGERKDKTEWHSVVIFAEGLARVASQYLKKGSKVYLEGQLQTRKWQDKEGNDRYSTEVILQGFNATLILLDSRQNGGQQQQSGYTSQQYATATGGGSKSYRPPSQTPVNHAQDIDDDIPF